MVESVSNPVPQGMRDLKPDKLPERDSERWSKPSGSDERGTVNEAGTSQALAVGGCQMTGYSERKGAITF
ncbi:hypothetical protein CSP5_0144 [Cuniculiplasma divulgatum]|jgi:hypothetical protein|uniref:Uncharacterized protein n=1 Tax=Cuniculiplasma divulgatum TaxID=1673428 RepID=A0A1N5SAD3_9ARCH|nr:MAG: hypothetical protein AMDU5_GPLC00004G0315 [Thermoplasmatales archaeon Gpl]SIM33004.1 hypothetical protein CSP5_0144 [Cuniculiplasma divulgatum]